MWKGLPQKWLPVATMLRMRVIGIKALKDKLSEYVKLAAAGETVLVTDRDRVVAELGPPSEGRSPSVSDAVLMEAVRNGWLSPPASPRTGLPARVPVAPLETILRELEEDRNPR
jgi:antitoxin (DNA-binding transcriptional repressor) of toxin-antitoxin stability system